MANNKPKRVLPLLSTPHLGGRSAMTCKYRCGDACSHPVPNTSDNPYFGDLVAEAVSRRGMLRAGALGALVVGAGVALPSGAAVAGSPSHGRGPGSRLRFTPVAPNNEDKFIVASGYQSAVIVRWGDPVVPGAPAFDFDNQTAAAQAKQFGYNCDYVMHFPLSRDRALLWVNHEYTNEELMFRGYTNGAAATEEQLKIALEAHGGSIVEIERVGRSGRWMLVTSGKRRYNRRFTGTTKYRISGPAAGHPLLRTAADPSGRTARGMLNNCSGGTTPWGTVLTCEENFNQYFGASAGVPAEAQAALTRYGVSFTALPGRRWDRVEERFDLTKHPNEVNRFGWVVEIDPFDPDSTPIKRTALGRVKHEAANTTLSKDGRVVVYLGDDERFDYIYKFVSADRYRPGSRRHNQTLLDHGTLYVAKFTGDSPPAEFDGTGKLPSDGSFDGTGQWIPLASGNKSFVDGMSAAEVLIHARLAADKVGATKMDRPEDIERNPETGAVYVALSNNVNRTAAQADEANPRANNKHGQILEISESRNDAAALTFRWDLPIVCGDPSDASTYFAGFDKSKVSPISSPDNVMFDSAGNLWIASDSARALNANDGLYAVPVEGSERGYLRQFLSVPLGAETCGPLITKDQKTVFVAVQHPGEATGASPDNPFSRWPDGDQPRPSVVSVWHPAGKDIGN